MTETKPAAAEKQAAPRRTVIVKKPWEHKSIWLVVGSKVDLREDQIARLTAGGYI